MFSGWLNRSTPSLFLHVVDTILQALMRARACTYRSLPQVNWQAGSVIDASALVRSSTIVPPRFRCRSRRKPPLGPVETLAAFRRRSIDWIQYQTRNFRASFEAIEIPSFSSVFFKMFSGILLLGAKATIAYFKLFELRKARNLTRFYQSFFKFRFSQRCFYTIQLTWMDASTKTPWKSLKNFFRNQILKIKVFASTPYNLIVFLDFLLNLELQKFKNVQPWCSNKMERKNHTVSLDRSVDEKKIAIFNIMVDLVVRKFF